MEKKRKLEHERTMQEIENKRERSTHEAGLRRRDIFCFHELVFFPFSSEGYRGQKEQTKNNDYIHNGA